MLESYVQISYLIPLLPLLGALLAGLLGARWLRGQSHWPIWITVLLSALMSVGILVHMIHEGSIGHGAGAHNSAGGTIGYASHWFNWISAGSFQAAAGAWIDPLSAVMLVVVTGIGLLICVFAAGYMKGESGYFRFFAYLGLFIFAMTCLVMGNNFIMLYLGWEGVGLCSYLLIGYYYDKPAAREAAKKAFLVNRVGDFGFGVGIMLLFLAFGSVGYFTYTDPSGIVHPGVLDIVFKGIQTGTLTPFQQQALNWIPFCLMVGAFGKSAQFPLYVWLPDAMEGPTPVSALIHAATMVTAGVYMIARCGLLFAASSAALTTVAVIGAFTAIFAATIALRQFDLKKVFAYSTISQLGFMFVGVGVLAPVAGVFHLVTHAFFKALLFLSSGVVMHAMMGELDMRKMSGLKTVLPKTRWLMLIGCAALAGFPFLSGFYSKDQIVAAAWQRHWLLGLVLLVTALLTAYYTFRLYFRVFEGPRVVPPPPPADSHGHGAAGDSHGHGHGGHHHHNHEPTLMIFPLLVLAVGSLVVGFLLAQSSDHLTALGKFLGQSPSFVKSYEVAKKALPGVHLNPAELGQHAEEPAATALTAEPAGDEHNAHMIFMIVSGAIAILGIWLAYWLHLRNRAAGEALPRRVPALANAIENKYWVDEIYQAAIVEPLRTLGKLFFAIDRIVVDGLVWFVSFVPQLSGLVLKLTTQRGYLQGYAAGMVFGILVILLIVFL